MGQGAYLSTALAIRIVVREVGQAVVGVVVAAEVVVVGTRVVALGRVARAAVVVLAPPAALRLANSHGVLDETTTRLRVEQVLAGCLRSPAFAASTINHVRLAGEGGGRLATPLTTKPASRFE